MRLPYTSNALGRQIARYLARSLANSWLVPTSPVRVRVQARGFRAAWYGADGAIERSEAITLSSRQILTVVIALSPLQ